MELIYKKAKAAELREPSSAKGDQINIQRGILVRIRTVSGRVSGCSLRGKSILSKNQQFV